MGYTALVNAISADVIAGLAKGGWPPLVNGKIMLGRQHQFEQSRPPRIVMIPTKNPFAGKDTYDASLVGGSRPDTRKQRANPSIRTDFKTFEVRCWGASPTKDRSLDYDFTEALYEQVIRSAHNVATGTYEVSDGEWTDETQLVQDGREFVFEIVIGTPVTRYPVPLQYAPEGTVTQSTVQADVGGVIETAAIIRTP